MKTPCRYRQVRLAAFWVGWMVFVGWQGIAFAGEVVFKKHTVVEFGDDTIEGDLSKPDGQYLESRKRLRHQRLIRVRENFRQEILKTVKSL